MFHSKRVRWSVAAAAAAAVVAVVGFWPGSHGNGAAWADVIRQLQAARTVHIHGVWGVNTDHKRVADIYLKAPDRMREEYSQPSQPTMIYNGKRQVMINPARKLYQVIAAPSPLAHGNRAQVLLQTFTLAGPQAGTQQAFLLDQPCELVFDGAIERDGRQLRRYVLRRPNQAADEQTTGYFWFDEDNRLVLVTNERIIDGKPVETDVISVALDIDLPDEMFSVEKPADYEDVGASTLFANAGPDIRAIHLEYQRARERMKHYRLVAWYGPEVAYRCARNGQKWRIDKYESDRAKIGIENDLDVIWGQLDQVVPQQLLMPHGDRVANLVRGRDASGSPLLQMLGTHPDAVRDQHLRLEDLGWPEWPSDVPSARQGPLTTYERLPDRPDRPGLIGLRAVSDRPQRLGLESNQSLDVFWIDPGRDYLSVLHEVHVRKGRPWLNDFNWEPTEPKGKQKDWPRTGFIHEWDKAWEVTEFAQTTDGWWYPAAVIRTGAAIVNGKSYREGPPKDRLHIRVDTAGAVPDSLFEWPADAPKLQ